MNSTQWPGQPSPPPVSIAATLGALEIGSYFAVLLFGLSTLQTYMYFSRYPSDQLSMKALVLGVWVLDLSHSVTMVHIIYSGTITLAGRPSILWHYPSLVFTGFLGAFINLIVQSFFAFRIYRIIQTRWVAYLCWFLSVIGFSGAITVAVGVFISPNLASFKHNFGLLLSSVLAMGAGVDIVIAIAMCSYLMSKQRSGLEVKTERVLDLLMLWTIETGLVTSVTAVAVVILFQALPGNFAWLGLHILLAKLYTNSFLASLNSRTVLRKAMYSTILSSGSTQPRSVRASDASAISLLRSGGKHTPPSSSFEDRTFVDSSRHSGMSDRKESYDSGTVV